jgi:hypothetical protein
LQPQRRPDNNQPTQSQSKGNIMNSIKMIVAAAAVLAASSAFADNGVADNDWLMKPVQTTVATAPAPAPAAAAGIDAPGYGSLIQHPGLNDFNNQIQMP